MLGRELAETLGILKDTNATLLATLPAGSQNAMDVTAWGTVEPGMPLQDKTLVLVPLRLAQSLLRMDGQVTEFAVSVHDFSKLTETKGQIQAAIGDKYEVLTWRERDRVADRPVSLGTKV